MSGQMGEAALSQNEKEKCHFASIRIIKYLFGVFALCRIVTIPRYWLTVYNQSEAISNTSPDLIGILFVSGTVLGKIIR